jgi:exonuclease III
VALGDANLCAKSWNENNFRYKELANEVHTFLLSETCSQIVNKFTRVQKVGNTIQKSCIDHVTTNTPDKCSVPEVYSTANSDHLPVMVTKFSREVKTQPRTIKKRNYKNFSIKDFLNDVNANVANKSFDKVLNNQNIDEASALFSGIFGSILNRHAPLKVFQVRNNYSPWISEETKQMNKDPGGRYVGIVGDHEEGKFLVISFYSPSVENEIKNFVANNLCAELLKMGEDMPEFFILGGDSNTVFSRLDKEGGSKNLKCNAINAFDNLKNEFNLFDTFRSKNPFAREYSWETLNPNIIRERIDIIFASNSLQDYVTETGIIPSHKTCSDHGIPYVRIKGYGIPTKGPGVWKLNNTLLSEPSYVAEMKEKLPIWISEAENDLPGNVGSQWGFIKHKIGEFSRVCGAKIKKQRFY